jgi:hypothetical protein
MKEEYWEMIWRILRNKSKSTERNCYGN